MSEVFDETIETMEEVPFVDVDIDVDEATIVLKLIVTPLLCDISVWIRDSISVSCNTLRKYR
jgi:hypothetical protein